MGASESTPEQLEMRSPATFRRRVQAADMSDDVLLGLQVPESFHFQMDGEGVLADCTAILQDQEMALLRYRLVPLRMTESEFWRRLFYAIDHPMAAATPEHPCTPPAERAAMPLRLARAPQLSSPSVAVGMLPLQLNAAPPPGSPSVYTPCGTSVHGYEDDFQSTPRR